ncbi:leucine-rich repeat domain-containing protein [Paraclostridium sordellii]|uniref:leucine-rich repeat domain-containing protein n=1 Tax=Paraclostridium sordellii TaxID=1505 RepID=UPI0005E762DF|nr:leucine-rich repeat domain-containing protein [Paeniclostridium sordellii]CEN81179.1 internalin A-like protein/ S-layer protein [[Clostridium] sordellii] [Paeniclostridium sordellii]
MKFFKKSCSLVISLVLSSMLLTGCNLAKNKNQDSSVSTNEKKVVKANKKAPDTLTSKKHSSETTKEISTKDYLNDDILSNQDKKTVNKKLDENRIVVKKEVSKNSYEVHNANKKYNKIKSEDTKFIEEKEVKKDNKIKKEDIRPKADNQVKENNIVKKEDNKLNEDNEVRGVEKIKGEDTKSTIDNQVRKDDKIKDEVNKPDTDNEVKEDEKTKDEGNKLDTDNEVKEDEKTKDEGNKPDTDNEVKEDEKTKDEGNKPDTDKEVKEDEKIKDEVNKPDTDNEVKEDEKTKDEGNKPDIDKEVKEDEKTKDEGNKPDIDKEVKEDEKTKDEGNKPDIDNEVKEDEKTKDEVNKPDEELVNINDEYLRKAVNKALGRDENSLDKITAKDMENITKIDSGFLALHTDEKGEPRRGIKSLDGLEYAKNLKTLKVSMNSITDLTPIKDLTNLEFLEVFRNEISDLTPLKNLENLEHLDIYNNKGIVNLEPISKLNKINFIDMHYCNRRSARVTFEDLGSLTNLEFLSIDDDFVDDLSFVKNLKKLSTFSCNNNYVTDLSYIQALAADSFEDWSGDKFFNMYGQMLKEDIKVEAPSEGIVYKMKCPVTGADKYIEKIYKTYEITEGLPAISNKDENKNISLRYNKFTNELELIVGKNTSSKKTNTKFNAVLEYGMYSLKMTFDITQDGAKDISKVEVNEI